MPNDTLLMTMNDPITHHHSRIEILWNLLNLTILCAFRCEVVIHIVIMLNFSAVADPQSEAVRGCSRLYHQMSNHLEPEREKWRSYHNHLDAGFGALRPIFPSCSKRTASEQGYGSTCFGSPSELLSFAYPSASLAAAAMTRKLLVISTPAELRPLVFGCGGVEDLIDWS